MVGRCWRTALLSQCKYHYTVRQSLPCNFQLVFQRKKHRLIKHPCQYMVSMSTSSNPMAVILSVITTSTKPGTIHSSGRRARSRRRVPRDWLTAAMAPLESAMATTIRKVLHWFTMPRAAWVSALIRPATQTATKPMKNIRYIMSIWGQVRLQTTRGLVLRSPVFAEASAGLCLGMLLHYIFRYLL